MEEKIAYNDIDKVTIQIDSKKSEVKNIPLVRIFEDDNEDINDIYSNINNKINFYGNSNIAIAFKGPENPTYKEIRFISDQIIKAFKLTDNPIIVVLESNFSKTLGEFMRNKLRDKRIVICIDRKNILHGTCRAGDEIVKIVKDIPSCS
jgi:ethanolamine utilization protein EutA